MARRFRFRLAPLLTLRMRTEEDRKKEFAAAGRAVQEERERRERLLAEQDAMRDDIVRMYADKTPFAYITATYRELGNFAGEIMRSELRQQELERVWEEVRGRLIEAQRERRALEILRDNQKAAFDREMDRLEQAQLDELAIRARGRLLRQQTAESEAEEEAARLAAEANPDVPAVAPPAKSPPAPMDATGVSPSAPEGDLA